jgi:hypothetical protein
VLEGVDVAFRRAAPAGLAIFVLDQIAHFTSFGVFLMASHLAQGWEDEEENK